MYFNGGSRTFVGTIGGNGLADLELNGQNAIVAGGLFVNNGHVSDNSALGISTVIADYGALVKGGGSYDNSPITRNGGRFQSGNSPGVATMGRFVFGPGGVSNYVFAISNATGQAGPTPDANGQVSGWGLVKTGQWQRGAGATSGDFVWTADSTNKVTVTLDTLVNPTIAGTDVHWPDGQFRSDEVLFLAGRGMGRRLQRPDECRGVERGYDIRHQRVRQPGGRDIRLEPGPREPNLVADLHAERRAGAGNVGVGRISRGRIGVLAPPPCRLIPALSR